MIHLALKSIGIKANSDFHIRNTLSSEPCSVTKILQTPVLETWYKLPVVGNTGKECRYAQP